MSVNQQVTAGPSTKSSTFRKKSVPYLLIFPAVLFVAGVLAYAVISGILLSFFQYDLNTIGRPFVWFQNYIYLFTNSAFLNSLMRSIIFVALSVIIGLILGLAFAISLYRTTKYGDFFKGLSLIPYLVSGVATAVMFRFMFASDVGLINMILDTFGLEQVLFLADPNWALFVTVLANVWGIVPFTVLILLSGIQAIDSELFEAAIVDGASKLNLLFKILLPLISPMMGIALIWLSFASFNMFDVILPLTGGGPLRATEYLAVYMYNVAFTEFQYSLGSTVMVVILFFNVTLSVIYLKIFKSAE
ncbi:sugar ABC transporter permease [Gracilibacillus sp. YIM 98692]|uniref:carbohydrate ABC transporter permease n=1 Tax=Gracilibacillus sp. YIM 98692 TaxID=2663532 RepID=UPI0013CF9487|nr:sugar ABC transporter permease [Gracilibacillus sp. YIM 98692]